MTDLERLIAEALSGPVGERDTMSADELAARVVAALSEQHLNPEDWRTEAIHQSERVNELTDERDRLLAALEELLAANDPWTEQANPGEKLTGEGLREWQRWLAAIAEARAVLEGTNPE